MRFVSSCKNGAFGFCISRKQSGQARAWNSTWRTIRHKCLYSFFCTLVPETILSVQLTAFIKTVSDSGMRIKYWHTRHYKVHLPGVSPTLTYTEFCPQSCFLLHFPWCDREAGHLSISQVKVTNCSCPCPTKSPLNLYFPRVKGPFHHERPTIGQYSGAHGVFTIHLL